MKRHDLISLERAILQQIALDELQAGDTIPSVRALQARLFMSRGAVLTALHSLCANDYLQKGTSARQGYTLCQSIKALPTFDKEERSLTVQYLLPFTTWNYVINKYLSHFESVFAKHNISLLFYNTHNSVEEEGRLLESLQAKAPDKRPDFLFLMTSDSVSNPNVKLLQEISKSVSVILIDRYFPDMNFHYIGVNNTYIGCQTAKYLLQRGHQNIAYIKAYGNISPIRDRLLGFQQTLSEAAVSLQPESIFLMKQAVIGSISEIQNEVDDIGSQILALPIRPTAVVCSFDRIAVALIRFFMKNNLRIPEDISVIGCDNDVDVAAMSPLILTTFRHPYRDCANDAIERIHLIQSSLHVPPRSVEFYSELTPGESSELLPIT